MTVQATDQETTHFLDEVIHRQKLALSAIQFNEALKGLGIAWNQVECAAQETVRDAEGGMASYFLDTGRAIAVRVDGQWIMLDQAYPYPWSHKWTPELVAGPPREDRFRWGFERSFEPPVLSQSSEQSESAPDPTDAPPSVPFAG